MAIPVKLPVFEGPLDLLLHLIEKNQVDIYDIPIVEITEQYMAYIRQMEKNLSVMSEFMVMAATLLDIKSRMLLPAKESEEGEEEDPRGELVQQLLEYKMYKYMSYELKERMEASEQLFYKSAALPEEVLSYQEPVDPEELLSQVSLTRLRAVFHSLLKRQEEKIDPIRSKFGRIEEEEVSLGEKLGEVSSFVKAHEAFTFADLLQGKSGKNQIIVTFLAILELMKMGKIRISQEELFGDIRMERIG